jgi:malate dehydrogenase
MTRLAVVGVGRIGGEVAYLASLLGIADEMILYDSAPGLLKAQVLDLLHTGIDMAVSTDKNEVRNADICIFAAGLPRNPAVKTRADLLAANLPVTREIAGMLVGFSGILITVTNPMDANNWFLHKLTGIPREHCIGFGGQLDSARFRLALKNRGIAGTPFVIGEHGEHQVPVFSRLAETVDENERNGILSELRGSSMEVIRGKGGTAFGPAFHISQLIRMIAEDRRELISCSSVLDGEYGLSGCSLGVPARIGKGGIHAIEEWTLDAWEQEKMAEAGRFASGLCTGRVP